MPIPYSLVFDNRAMPNILIVEDEPNLAELLCEQLGKAGLDTQVSLTGDGVVERVRRQPPDLILLDLLLPGMDGMDICRGIRRFSNVPIVMVTSRVEEIDRLLGLELGADDYICKPYSPREVVARVKAVLRRAGGGDRDSSAGIAGLEIDAKRFIAHLHGKTLDLTPSEFRLLAVLARSPGRVYSRGQLQDRLYDDHRVVSDRTIDTHIKNLRRKIAEVNKNDALIQSVYSVGYKLEPKA